MFTYQDLLDDIQFLNYSGIDTGSVGKSECGNEIPYIHFGELTGKQIIISGGIHSRENVSSILVIRQAYHLARQKPEFNGGIYFVPMVNPDGALLIEKGADFFPSRKDFLLKVNGGGDFSLWKANINAVGLNTNFDANHGKGISNKTFPSPADFIGPYPFSESETAALRDFMLAVAPAMTISYHALGRELYWYFGQTCNYDRDNLIAGKINDILSYNKIDSDLKSAGGYKDWCIQKLGIPSITIELIPDSYSHPVPESALEDDWRLNKDLPLKALEILHGIV